MTVSTRSVQGYAVAKHLGDVSVRGFAGYAIGSAVKASTPVQVNEVVGYAATQPTKPSEIHEVLGYAMTGPARAVQLNEVVGYGLTLPSKVAQIYNVVGYASIIPPKALPKNITGYDALIQVIINTQRIDYEVEDFSLDPPEAMGNPTLSHNTTVVCNAGVSSYLYGSMEFMYYRRELGDCYDGADKLPIDLTGMTNTLDLLPAINALTGMILTSDDIVSTPIQPGQTLVNLTAKSTSWFFQPGTTLRAGNGTEIPLSSAFGTDTIVWS